MILTSTAFQNKLQDTTSRIVHMKIETYDTKMCTETKGVPFVMYEWDGTGTPNWGSIDRLLPSTSSNDAVLPNLAFNWPYSSPFFINTPYYAIEFSGFFYSEEASSDFGFYVFGDNQEVSLEFDGATHIVSSSSLRHSPLQFAKSASADSVGASSWDAFTFRVWGETGARNNGVALMYTNNFSSVDEADFASSDLKIVNAGVCNTSAGFESAEAVTHFSNVQGDRKRNEPTEYTFEVPLGDETGAYIRNSINEYVNGSITLHEGRLIKIWAGYECDTTPTASQTEGDVVGNIEYIPRFSGFIYGFEANRDNDTLRVRCRDFFSRTEETFCINYPNASSYWSSGYFLLNQPGEPDGIGTPVAYDRWNVVKAILDLFVKAGIPASLFYSYEKGRATGGNVSDTVRSVYDADYSLSFAPHYGTSQVEEYLNRYDVGTTVFEGIMKIVDTYGYDIEFKPDGNLRFFPKDNPTGASIGEAIIDSPSAGTGHAEIVASAAQGGTYYNLNTGSDNLQFTNVSGTGFSLIVRRSATGGASDNNNLYTGGTASVDVTITINGGSQVWTDSFNFYFEQEWFYSQGVSSLIGANPCVIDLTRSLDYDSYDILIEGLSTYDIDIDQLWAYHNNTSDSVKILQTYKTTGVIASISSLDYERGLEDLRNDILIVGQRRGIWVADGNQEVAIDDPEFSANQNNQFVNYHSRAVDVESIYNPSASNYTGRHLMTYVQEPSINTYARADWLSFNMLNTYRNYKNRINFSLVGDPEVYINDPVSVKDKVEEDGTNTVWVEGFSETINKTDWNVKIDVVGNKPYPSYTEDQDYDVENDYNDGFIADLVITDSNGNIRDGSNKTTTTGGSQSWATGTLNVVDDTGFGSSGTVVVYHKEFTKYGVATYTGSGSNALTGVSWMFTPSDAEFSNMPSIPSGWKVENIYNPYERSDHSEFVTLSFRCLVTGTISVGVKNESLVYADIPVYRTIGGLTAGGGLTEGGLPKQQEVFPGEVVNLIWGGIDQTNLTHVAVHGDNTQIGMGYFAESGQYYFSIDFYREEDGRTINLSTNEYRDESDVLQNKSVGMGLSGEEEHVLSYNFVDPVTGTNQDRSTSTYSPGGSGGQFTNVGRHTNGTTYVNTNHVWVSTDGNIDINLKSFFINTSRTYYITYSVDVISFTVSIVQETFVDAMINGGADTERVVTSEAFQNGSPVTWDNSSGYTFSYNPTLNQYGGISIDEIWAGVYNNLVDEYGDQSFLRMGKAYWIRLLLDIRDASGRRIKYRDSRDNNNRIPEIHNELTNAIDQIYSDRNWDTVIEFMVIPAGTDTRSGGVWASDGRLTNKAYSQPLFEAKYTSLPFNWIS